MTSTVVDSDDFHHFYAANYGDTVAMTYGYTADLGEAQDIAQEAFARAWQRWRDVSRYDNPVSWVRRVATNLAHSRWRRLKVATAHLLRERPPEPAPAVDPDHIAVVAALRKLPVHHREALVLHYLLDMPVNDIAEQLDVAVGTVKSWLHRGRAALADDLRIDVRGSITTPPATVVEQRGRKQRRNRTITAISAIFLAVAGVLGGVALAHPGSSDPRPPAATYSLDPNDPMLAVDWSATAVQVGQAPAGCPTGQVDLRPTQSEWIGGPSSGWPRLEFHPLNVAVGDLTGDGRAEAALAVACSVDPDSDDRVIRLLAVELRDTGLHSLAWTGRDSSIVMKTWISGGVLYADSRPHVSSQTWRYELGRVDGWRWAGNDFEPVDTTDRYPPIRAMDMTAVAAQLDCEGAPERVTRTPGVDDAELFTTDGRRHQFRLQTSGYDEIFAEFGRRGDPYLLLGVTCRDRVALVLFDRYQTTAQWRAVTAVVPGPNGMARILQVRPGTVVLGIKSGDDTSLHEFSLIGDTLVQRPASPAPVQSTAGG